MCFTRYLSNQSQLYSLVDKPNMIQKQGDGDLKHVNEIENSYGEIARLSIYII